MPTYEYECKTHGHRFEVVRSFTDDSITECEVCGEPVRKVFSAAGIVFKGSGFYVTDSRRSSKTPAGSTKGSSASDSGSSEKSATASASGGDSGS